MSENIVTETNAIAKRKAKDFKYNHSPAGVAARKKYMQSPKGKAAAKKRRESEYSHAEQRKGQKKYAATHPQRINAMNAVTNAIKYGRLQKPFIFMCHNCGKGAQEYHHWHGYGSDHWLDVILLCIPCHRKAHVTSQ